ncbi:MAG: hypothetical protein GY863_11940, partial [bacterium]|nr:hypothetical protein [bacterium]
PQKVSREYEAVLTVFLSEIEKVVTRDLVIVLDDYHLTHESIEINELLEFIIQNIPQQLHLVIISRIDPGLHLSRFRARREVLDIKEENIVFTISEVERLYSQVFDVSLQHESLESLHQKTDGWVSGLILFYHSIKGKGQDEIEELLLKLKGSHRNISNYLEENVYDLQPDNIKEFLVKTSILTRMSAPFCNQLLGINNSRQILKNLEKSHLFIFPLSEEREWYSYHHLFHDFLRTKFLYELDRETILKLHNDAAVLWEKQDESEEVLRHYLRAEQFEKVCSLLGNWGLNKLIIEGRQQLISSYLKKIPDSYLNKEPWIQYLQAHVLELSGKLEEAIPIYNKALKTFRRYNYSDGEALCQKSLVYNYLVYGDHKSALNILKVLPDQLKDVPQLCIDILGVLAFLSAHQLKMTAASRYFNDGLALSAELDNINIHAAFDAYQAFWHSISGDFREALKIG